MKQRFACLVLLLMMAGGTFAGVPMQFGESECSMVGMMDMDCCKAARIQTEQSGVTDAKLICALNCAQNGSTVPIGINRVASPSPAGFASHPAIKHPLPNSSVRFRRAKGLPGPSGAAAAYLRNLALLI